MLQINPIEPNQSKRSWKRYAFRRTVVGSPAGGEQNESIAAAILAKSARINYFTMQAPLTILSWGKNLMYRVGWNERWVFGTYKAKNKRSLSAFSPGWWISVGRIRQPHP